MQTTRDRLRNTLEIWMDNMLLDGAAGYAEPVQVAANPLHLLYQNYGISVTTMVQDNQLLVAVGAEGSADVIHTQPFNDDADFAPAATAIVVAVDQADPDAIDHLTPASSPASDTRRHA